MIVNLQNIKCYENQTFDFGEKGVALLSGQSGKGKSSIIQGIYFALFGVGNKIITCGKISCKVELQFDDIKIVRTKNPTKLILNDVYEDDEAQSIINQKFGVAFDVTGYIPQNSVKSFILMNPSEKISFLEKFALSDINLEQIKTKCKEQISRKHEELIDVTARLETMLEIFEQLDEPEYVCFPLIVKNNNYEKAIKNENTRYKNTIVLIHKNRDLLNQISEQISNYKLLDVRVKEYDKQKTSLENKRIRYENEIKYLYKDYIGDEELEKLQNQLNYIRHNRYLSNLQNNYETDKKNLEQLEHTEMNNLVDDFTKINLWEEYSKEDIENIINSNIELLRDSERLYTLKNKRKKYENKLTIEQLKIQIENEKQKIQDIKLQKTSYNCPSCSKRLKFENGKLMPQEQTKDCKEITEDEKDIANNILILEKILNFEEEIEKIEKIYEETIPEPDEINSDLELLKEYKYTQITNESKKKSLENKIENKIFSASVISLREKLKKTECELKKIQKEECKITESFTKEEDLIKQIDVQKTIQVKTRQIDEILNSIIKEIKEVEINYEKLKDIQNSIDINELENKVFFTENEIKNLQNKKIKHEKNLTIVQEWKKMKEELQKYQEIENKILDLQKSEKTKKEEYLAFTTLKENILEAESIAVINIVNSINEHARIYLDCFFENDPIFVELQAFKQVKKQLRAQINLNIQYKGNDCDLNMLSGGEVARVVLAYTLALAEMFNTPLLMLDECTSSLDQETTDNVFETIRDNFKGKLTIIIAHQVVTGTFDKIINLS